LNIFHSEDVSIFTEALHDVIANKKSVVAEVRMKHKDGSYLWQCGRIAPILDETGNVVTVIGRISNIDKQKRETEHLLIKSMLDPLTNLTNKISTQAAIDDFLLYRSKNELSAMLAIDIDDFKFINDKWGHLFGDTVLTDIANIMKNIFREDDIIGRFGGDEFIVFLKDTPSENFAINLSTQLLNIFSQTYSVGDLEYKFSASIGISFYNKHGKTFSELYEKADKALYYSKKNGKNQYCVFVDSIDQQEPLEPSNSEVTK
jgi:diguanylate cyclase (GGDEF)-like protein